MTNIFKKLLIFFTLSALLLLGSHAQISSREKDKAGSVPEKMYIELTRDFYEAISQGDNSGQRVYSNDPSTEYLREISVSSRFIVETNLQILRQQEHIISLLETMAENKSK